MLGGEGEELPEALALGLRAVAPRAAPSLMACAHAPVQVLDQLARTGRAWSRSRGRRCPAPTLARSVMREIDAAW